MPCARLEPRRSAPSSNSQGISGGTRRRQAVSSRPRAPVKNARLSPEGTLMFDLRYHVASLAAVFLALVIGILVGVGISDRGYVDKGYRGLLEQRIAKLQSDLNDARRQADDLSA